MKKFFIPILIGAMALAATAQAKIVTKAVGYEQAGVKLEGWLAYDDSVTGKRPGILVVPEWWGLNDFAKGKAEALAKLGYVAFATDMYGKGVVTEDPKKAGELAGQFYGKPLMADRARAGLDQLLATGLVANGKVAAIGFCFGGATCQALAYSGAPLAGIVSFHGSLIPAPAGAGHNAKILMLHGAADTFISAEQISAFEKSMKDGGFDMQWISYPGAVHAFTNPDATRMGVEHKMNIAYNEPAATASWAKMQEFFRGLFGK
jgi:dienelactone hydrolase